MRLSHQENPDTELGSIRTAIENRKKQANLITTVKTIAVNNINLLAILAYFYAKRMTKIFVNQAD